jgi:hypothetical protein
MAKTSLLPVESLVKRLRSRFPDATIEIDRPRSRTGDWYLDMTYAGHPVVIQWKDGAGFGVSSSTAHVYGDGADETYQDEEATYGRVVSLLLSRAFTAPPEPVRLSELRKERGITQSELAEILNKPQGEISKIERRQDVKLSTLRDYVQSVGGTLQVLARMPGGIVHAIEIEDEQKTTGPKKVLVAGH